MSKRIAIISVFDKDGIDIFAKALQERDFMIVSTDGTARFLRDKGLKVEDVTSITDFPEILDGRVKTLHPNIHAGILARRYKKEDMKTLESLRISPIDVVVCNLYPFEETIKRENVLINEVLENIDIGGPTLIRAAAKNFRDVIVVVNPSRYQEIIDEMDKNGGIGIKTKENLAVEAFEHVARYDAVISNYLRRRFIGRAFPSNLVLPFEIIQETRYGENPHQRGAFYKVVPEIKDSNITDAKKLQGKELSYNNILDADCAIDCIKEFEEPSAVIVKHATPCGIASANSILQSWKDAYETDTYSPFGGVVSFNREINRELAEELSKLFLEVIIAPSFSKYAIEILSKKKKLRLLQIPNLDSPKISDNMTYRSVGGGILLQDSDNKKISTEGWRIVTKVKPSDNDIKSMIFAVKCVKHIKSNAVVFVKGTKTVAIGGGQTARVDASWIATHKGGEKIKNSIMASDAFFPFRDAVDVAAKAGVKAIVQPGGSIRDEEVIEAANDYGIAMVFTGQRYFRH